jgi:hypothetical protein
MHFAFCTFVLFLFKIASIFGLACSVKFANVVTYMKPILKLQYTLVFLTKSRFVRTSQNWL